MFIFDLSTSFYFFVQNYFVYYLYFVFGQHAERSGAENDILHLPQFKYKYSQ